MNKKSSRNLFSFLFFFLVVLWTIGFGNSNYGHSDSVKNGWSLATDSYTVDTTLSSASTFFKSLLSVTSVHAGRNIEEQTEEDLSSTNVKDTYSIYFEGEKLEKDKRILPNLGSCCSKGHSFWGCYQSWVWCY